MLFPGMSDAPGFDDPLEMLRACHGRIQSQCATLEKLRVHLPAHGCDLQARQAALAILRYFDTAGRNHHLDEEQDLFPMLVLSGDARALRLVDFLLARHVELDAAWAALRIDLTCISAGTNACLEDTKVSGFIAAYQSHIEIENAELLPLAQELLSVEQVERLGRAMSTRRGVVYTESD